MYKTFLLILVVLASMLGGCAVWMEPAGYAVYHERPVYVYRAPTYHYHQRHYRGRPVHVHHGKQIAAHAPHGKKAVAAKKGGHGRGRGHR